jgi:low temperature requirement protein LtrA
MQASISPTDSTPVSRVSTLELFFDLVFVFTITQVSHLILEAHSFGEVLKAFLVLSLTWWMYGAYAWLTNNVGTRHPLNRLLIFTAMAGFLVMALAVPHAFDGDGLAFGLAYLMVNVIHTLLFTRALDPSSSRAIWRIAPINIGTALLVVGAGFMSQEWNWLLWVGAVAILLSIPWLGGARGFALQPTHFVERHGLVLIIALGESIISIGVGAEGEAVTPSLVTAVVLTLALIAALWWSYFARDEERAEHTLSHATLLERGRMALLAFGYAYLGMITGIVLLAAGIHHIIDHLHEPTTLTASALLASGVSVYLLGDVLFRRFLHITFSRLRFLIALVSLATIPIGLWAGGKVQVAVLLGLMIVIIVGEKMVRQKLASSI